MNVIFAGDVDEFSVQPLSQGQFTPLPEALCRVILELTSTGQCAAAPRIRAALRQAFPAMHQPSHELVYDALAQLMQENKVRTNPFGGLDIYFILFSTAKALTNWLHLNINIIHIIM